MQHQRPVGLETSGSQEASRQLMAVDAADSVRGRLLRAATTLFATRGYAATSTRALCVAAGVNIASIAYYFGSKEDLYRAAVRLAPPQADLLIHAYADPGLSLLDALRAFYANLLTPLVSVGADQDRRRLHIRELVEPSGLLTAQDLTWSVPFHLALEGMLRRHVGIEHADADIGVLAHAVVGAGMHFCVSQRMVDAMSPGMLVDEGAVLRTADRLAQLASAMVKAERDRRIGR
jgi:TetR/AcrR family transcriptional regulator, regulator of cefoperazone and chloramphenicol sensitivity